MNIKSFASSHRAQDGKYNYCKSDPKGSLEFFHFLTRLLAVLCSARIHVTQKQNQHKS